MIKLNEIEREVLRVIKCYQRHFCNSPTIQEIADELHKQPTLIRYTVDKLKKKGYIDMQSPAVSDRLLIVPLWWE